MTNDELQAFCDQYNNGAKAMTNAQIEDELSRWNNHGAHTTPGGDYMRNQAKQVLADEPQQNPTMWQKLREWWRGMLGAI